MTGVGRLGIYTRQKTVQDVSTNFSKILLMLFFKHRVNEFKLRRHGITNLNTYRCSGRAVVTEKRRRNCKFHYFSAFKATELDGDSAW